MGAHGQGKDSHCRRRSDDSLGANGIVANWGYECVEAGTVAAALAAFDAEHPAAVLRDVNLPDGSGLEALGEIKRRQVDAVVIMVTGTVMVADTIAALRGGAYDFIGTNVALSKLNCLRGWLMTINERIVFKRILCPIDLAPESDEALRYGIALAKAYGAELLAINCVDSNRNNRMRDPEQIKRLLNEAVQRHLRLPATADFSWRNLVVAGDPRTAISQEAAQRRVDLIVMRSRRRPFAATLLGSTAESVCRTAPCPVMIIHSAEHAWAGVTTNEIGLQRVLVAYDFSSDSELALSYGLSLAQEYQAQIHVLHVLPARPSRPYTHEIAFLSPSVDDGLRDAASRLRDAVPAETCLWCEVKQAVREGQPYREVLAYAEDQKIDLICMGVSGTGFGMRALFGSNADRVLRQASCPVLIARPLRPALAGSLRAAATK